MFKYVEAKDEELIKKIYRFRYQIACEELNILKKENYPDCLEIDEYDRYSIHFAALNQKEEVVACLRLIQNSPIGYPMENEMKIKFTTDVERYMVGEISRQFIHKAYRDMRSTKEIFYLTKKHVCPKMKEIGLKYTYVAVEKSFYRLLRMMGMPYELIGKPQKHGGRLRLPCVLSTDKLIERNKQLCSKWVNK